ncbi:MAG: MFS transporter [Bacteroidetes bacterium]|nr:MFS transporter [Bacteroidota bacterium]
MATSSPRLYTTPFILLCASHVLFSGSFNMIIPELPDYLTSLGGASYKGMIIFLFTLAAGLSRPFSGKLTDTIGRVPVMVIGTLVCVVCSLLYPLISGVAGFLLLRFFHGFSTGFKPTAATAFAADIIPVARRGEAMGILGVSMNLGATMFPPVGSWITLSLGMDYMFFASSAIALISIVMLWKLPETLEDKQKFSPKLLKISPKEIIEPSAIAPAVVISMIYVGFGVILTIVPDQSVYVGMTNKGMFFVSLTIFSILSRLVAGRISDRVGRVPMIRISVVLIFISLILMGIASTPLMLMVSAGAFGFSHGIASPAVFAWVIDRSNDQRRGRAMATAYIALEVGIGFGAVMSAWAYGNDYENFDRAFFITAGISLMAIVYLWYWRRFRNPSNKES